VLQRVIHVQTVWRKCLDICSQVEAEIGVKQIKITFKNLYRELIIKTGVFIVPVGQKLGGQIAAQALFHAGLEQHLLGRLGRGPDRGTDENYQQIFHYSQTHLLQIHTP